MFALPCLLFCFPLTQISVPIPRHTFLLVVAQLESHGNPHSPILKKKSPSGLYIVLDQGMGTKLSDIHLYLQ